MRKLVVNADDFGFTHDVNQGIVEAHRHGILTATTLMANGAAFDHAVRLANQNPSLDIGVHLVLVGDPPFPATVTQLAKEITRGRIKIYEELSAQVKKILDAGLHPTHLDTHKHTHLLPPVLNAVARISEEYKIPWVRRPFDLPMNGVPLKKRAVSQAFNLVRGNFQRVLSEHRCQSTDHFAGFQITGTFTSSDLVHLIKSLPAGSTEFMCHPGFCTEELRAAPTRLKESRVAELKALTDPDVRAALTECGVQLVTYRQL